MAKGQQYQPERRFFQDNRTGVEITQLSSFPTVNSKFYFHVNAFTPDSKSLVFHSYKSASRNSQIDVFKVDVDGTGLTRLTDNPGVGGTVLSYDGQWLYYMVGPEFRRTSLTTYEEQTINRLERLSGEFDLACITYDDRHYYVEAVLDNGNVGIVRFAADGSEATVVYEGPGITHVQVEPQEGKTIAFQTRPDEQHRNIWLIDADGGNLRPFSLPYGNGHWMWVGGTGKIMSNLEKAHQGIAVMREGDEQAERLVEGEHFWHASSSLDGEWMVSDTNWPDNGIQIIHIKTKKYKTLCYTGSSSSHPQWTHPHPSFSPDGRYVVFNSDASGIPHLYLAKVPEELYAELSR